jgi:hypothetical protein
MPRITPYSRPASLLKLDGRTREAALLRKTRADLTAHVGGKPSATQKAMIERAAMLTLHLGLMDEKTLSAGGTMTEHDSRQYLAWSNSLTRALSLIGFDGTPAKVPTLAEVMASHPQAA